MIKRDPFERLRDELREKPVLKTRLRDWELFLCCRRACELTLLRQLAPNRLPEREILVTTIRMALRAWHKSADHGVIDTLLSITWPEEDHPLRQRATDLLAAYAFVNRSDPLELVEPPGVLRTPIVNPRGRTSKDFELSLGHDGIVRHGDQLGLLMHQPLLPWQNRQVDSFSDFTSLIALHAVSEETGRPLRGILYNQVVLREDGKRFERVFRGVTKEMIVAARRELWHLLHHFQQARKHNAFYPNRAFCRMNGQACVFLDLCASDLDEEVRRRDYRVEPR